MSVLEEIWRGEITPNERAIKPGSEYQKLTCKASAEEKLLLELLDAGGREVYERLCHMRDDLANISEADTFVQGFRLGARIMLEVLGEWDSQLPQVGGTG